MGKSPEVRDVEGKEVDLGSGECGEEGVGIAIEGGEVEGGEVVEAEEETGEERERWGCDAEGGAEVVGYGEEVVGDERE